MIQATLATNDKGKGDKMQMKIVRQLHATQRPVHKTEGRQMPRQCTKALVHGHLLSSEKGQLLITLQKAMHERPPETRVHTGIRRYMVHEVDA